MKPATQKDLDIIKLLNLKPAYITGSYNGTSQLLTIIDSLFPSKSIIYVIKKDILFYALIYHEL